ncbi:MAG: hypothetical protein IJ484_08320 [Oscillospiraceae bacterium]|nr:hypothetical protein [Oscillospiraceae bacterium]
MAFPYGYGELEDKLIDLFRSGPPDFAAAQALVDAGADVNAAVPGDGNVLSECLQGYRDTEHGDDCDRCDPEDGQCVQCPSKNPDPGRAMVEIVRFFLKNGFDPGRDGGRACRACLYALNFSTDDRYMLQAARLLLDAGIRAGWSPEGKLSGVLEHIATECSYLQVCAKNTAANHLYEAFYELCRAAHEGRAYGGIDTYEAALGRRVLRVLADPCGGEWPIRPAEYGGKTWSNTFRGQLYLEYEGGVLIGNEYGDFWTDDHLPAGPLVDVSTAFAGVVGRCIEGFRFAARDVPGSGTSYTQPVTWLDMGQGRSVRFSDTFGEMEGKELVGWFRLEQRESCGGGEG